MVSFDNETFSRFTKNLFNSDHSSVLKFIGETKIILRRDASGIYLLRPGKYCNNLATLVIPFFIVSKSSVGETVLKTVLSHFSKDPVA